MLFTKENAEKIKGLVEELNENYKEDEYYSNINTCLTFYPETMRVYERVIRFNNVSGFGISDITDSKNWEILSEKDVTLCFKAMLAYIQDNK